MEYFTQELWSEINDECLEKRLQVDQLWDEKIQMYQARFSSLENRLTKSVFDFFKNSTLHDYKMSSYSILQEKKGYKIKVNVDITFEKTNKKWRMSFKDVEGISTSYCNENYDRGFDTVGYVEILDVDSKVLSFEMLFASGASIRVLFKDKKCSISKIQ